MATKSIIKNIEISDPAEAEKLVKALEEAKKICDGAHFCVEGCEACEDNEYCDFRESEEGMERYDKKPEKTIEDHIGDIEAQQQEINLLIMEITELRESNQVLKDYAENADADKDEQAGTIMRLDNGLKKLRSSFQWLSESIRDLDYKAWAEDNIGKIDALLGGKEDA